MSNKCAELFGVSAEGVKGALNDESFGGKVPKYWTDHVEGEYAGMCVKQTSFFGGTPLLDEGVGYAIVLGFGIFFSIVTTFLVRAPASPGARFAFRHVERHLRGLVGRRRRCSLTSAMWA